MKQENSNKIRLNKFISDTGTCSRREADKLIEQGRVMVNGKLPEVGMQVSAKDSVRVDGRLLEMNEIETVYIAFNKPKGVTSTTELKVPDNIIRYINYPERIFPIGRLDKDSEGLIFLTNDGDIVNKILRAGNHHEKEYVVTVNKPINETFVERMGSGVSILGKMTRKCFVSQEGVNRFRIVLTQGMNRQIRRMCEALGYEVISLQRTRIMNVTLAKLPVGQWRYLTEDEIRIINDMVAESSKTEEASKAKTKKPKQDELEFDVAAPPRKAKSSASGPKKPAAFRPAGKFSGPGKSSSGPGGRKAAPKGSALKKKDSKSNSGKRGSAKVTGGKKRR